MISIFLFCFILQQGYSLVARLINLDDPTISTFDIHEEPSEPLNLVSNRMPIAFTIDSPNLTEDRNLDPRAGKVLIHQITRSDKGNSKSILGVEPCSEKHFGLLDLKDDDK